MTAPYSFQPLPVPSNVAPGPFQPAPTGGDYLQQGAGDLAKVLQALTQSSIQSRQVANEYDVGMGQVGAKRAENQRLIDEQNYKRQQDAQALAQKQQAGRAFLRTLSPDLQQLLKDTPPENLLGMVEPLQKSGRVGEIPVSQREMDHYTALLKTNPDEAAKYYELIRKPPGANVTVNTGANKTQELLVSNVGDAQKEAAKQRQIFPRLQEAFRDLQSGNVLSGPLANQLLWWNKALASVGGNEKAKTIAEATEGYIRETKSLTLGYLGSRDLGSGTAVSDTDRAFMQGMSGQDITMQPGALKRTLRINAGATLMKQEDAIQAYKYAAQFAGDAQSKAYYQALVDKETKQVKGNWNNYVGMLLEDDSPDAPEHVQGILQTLMSQYGPDDQIVRQVQQRIKQADAQGAQRVNQILRGKKP